MEGASGKWYLTKCYSPLWVLQAQATGEARGKVANVDGSLEGFRKIDHLECDITRTTRSRLTINIKSKIKIFSMKWLHL